MRKIRTSTAVYKKNIMDALEEKPMRISDLMIRSKCPSESLYKKVMRELRAEQKVILVMSGRTGHYEVWR
jgi:hypothetical protein